MMQNKVNVKVLHEIYVHLFCFLCKNFYADFSLFRGSIYLYAMKFNSVVKNVSLGVICKLVLAGKKVLAARTSVSPPLL